MTDSVSTDDGGYKPIRRQAVVVVHGQGQQRPMGTIRDFVKVLWSFNTELGPLSGDEKLNGRKTWIVPDEKSGLLELQRITTPEHQDRRTDFFELYYADLLDDTPIRNLWRWSQRLLWIDREDVTRRMRWSWTLFWFVNLLVLTLFVAFLLRLPDLFEESWLEPVLADRARVPLMVIGAALIILLLPRFSMWFAWLKVIPAWLLMFVMAGGVTAIYWSTEADASLQVQVALDVFLDLPAFLLLLVLAIVGYFISNVILPLFGDAASYLSAQTETVRSREAVRRRGLALLRALHDDSKYDRIVVVAHSLGTVLAYDLLNLLWREVGPTKDNPPSPQALVALEAVDEHTAEMGDTLPWPPDEIAKHQERQWAAFDALRQTAAEAGKDGKPPATGGWKVSDFVSLGSPLASAQFLVTEGRADFERMKKERVLPTAPADPYEPGELSVHEADGKKCLHHGAVFSAVRWTNLWDKFQPALVVFGDVISGPVSPQFGPAIRDIKVRIQRRFWLPRFFTHNYYWVDSDDPADPAEHVKLLREAVGMYH